MEIKLSQHTTLAQRIAGARQATDMSLEQAAHSLAVKTQTLNHWETGKTSPRSNKLQMLAGILGVSVVWLINGDEEFDPAAERPSRLDKLEQKVERMSTLQRQLCELSNDIADEFAMIRQADARLDDLVA